MPKCCKHKYFPIVGLLALLSANTNAAAPQVESCEQIRLKIMAQTGVLPRPDVALLEKLGARSECRFSAAEVYRAAYGDKPLPKDRRREGRRRHHDDD